MDFLRNFLSFFFQRFHTKADLAVFNSDYLDFYLVAFAQHVGRVFYALIADLGYMDKPRKTVFQIDKCAIVLEAVYYAFHNASYLDCGNFGFLCSFFFFLQDLPCGEYQAVLCFVDVDNDNAQLFEQIIFQILNLGKR